MKSLGQRLRLFMTAEEVPRWFGLSIVLIYLVGLGAVANIGITQARREGSDYFLCSSRFSVKLLAQQLAAVEGADAHDSRLVDSYQWRLRDFSSNVATTSLRVVDRQRRVISSTDMAELGSTVPPLQVDGLGADAEVNAMGMPSLFVRVPIARPSTPDPNDSDTTTRLNSSAVATASSASNWYLEASLASTPYSASSFADQARTAAVLLVVLGALFVVYRCLREQLRGVSRIASRLHARGDCLEEELETLRIAGTDDTVTTAWNELVDLTRRLQQTSEQKAADNELTLALERSGGGALAGALNALPDALLFVSDGHRLEYANSSALRLFGWTEEDARTVQMADVQVEGVGAKVLGVLREALHSDGMVAARADLVTDDEGDVEERTSYSVRVIPIRDARQVGNCLVVVRDVSQQLRSDRAREEFITQVTHELRTPLTNIRAYTETLSSGMFDDPKVVSECYNVITKETRRLSRLIEDMLSVSQLEVGTIELHVDSCDLKSLITDGVRDVRGLAEEKSIDLRLVLPSKLEPIRADSDKLAVVIINLLGNAIKYTPNGGNVVVGCQVTAEDVVITVKDNGIGIAPEDHARIFEKFQRAADAEVQSETGTGIGLFTAREIVRRHRGEIELISEKGQGSTFLVRLPQEATRAMSLSVAQGS